MDPISVANLAFGLIDMALKGAEIVGFSDPNVLKYASAGLFIARKATAIIADMQIDPSKYDDLTPEQIKALLTPSSWDEIEAEAKRQIALGG